MEERWLFNFLFCSPLGVAWYFREVLSAYHFISHSRFFTLLSLSYPILKLSLIYLPISHDNYYEKSGSCSRNRYILNKYLARFLALFFYIPVNVSRLHPGWVCVLMLADLACENGSINRLYPLNISLSPSLLCCMFHFSQGEKRTY